MHNRMADGWCLTDWQQMVCSQNAAHKKSVCIMHNRPRTAACSHDQSISGIRASNTSTPTATSLSPDKALSPDSRLPTLATYSRTHFCPIALDAALSLRHSIVVSDNSTVRTVSEEKNTT